MADTLSRLQEAVVSGDEELAHELAQTALEEGNQPDSILEQALATAVRKVAQLSRDGKSFMPDILMSIDAFNAAMDSIRADRAGEITIAGKVVIGTVAGNVHRLGKTMIVAMLEASGFEVINLGEDVPATTFVDTVREVKPDVLALGCYTTVATLELKKVVKCLEDSGLRKDVIVIIGGESTSQGFADELCVDAWGEDVLDTVEKVRQLVGSR